MRSIEKIIFNALVSRQPIGFPDFGALSVLRVSAEFVGDEVTAPINTVVFSEEWPEDTISIVDSMAALGVDREVAEHNYENWIGRAKSETGMFIKGVGVLKGGKFYMTKSLDRSLNPLHPDAIPAEREREGGLSRNERVWIGLIVGFVLILAVGWGLWYYHGYDGRVSNRHHERIKITRIADAEGVVEGEVEGDVAADATEGVVAEGEVAAEPAAPVEEAAVATPAISGDRYYVVGGVFSVHSNADSFIKLVKQAYPELKSKKIKYKGNIMVTLFDAPTEREAANMRRKIASELYNQDIWVYKWNSKFDY